MVVWTAAVEGDSDTAVLAAVLRSIGHELGSTHVCGGKGSLDKSMRGYVAAARHSAWIVLRDLDQDADCAPTLIGRYASRDARGCVRIAVRAVEAWLLGDPAAARWLDVPAARLPKDPESLSHPKRALIDLARASADRTIRIDMVPRGTASTGPGYVDQVRLFCSERWRPLVAARRCASLDRCLRYLRSRTGDS